MFSQREIKKYLKNYPANTNIQVDILVGPPAVGKDWVVKQLVDKYKTHRFLITTTSRPQRDNETNGVECNFLSKSEYENQLKSGKFATTFIYDGNYYGYRGGDLDEILQSGKNVAAIIYFGVLKDFLHKFPNSKIYFMFPPKQDVECKLLIDRMKVDNRLTQSRIDSIKEHMKLMYFPDKNSYYPNGLLKTFPQGQLFVINDNTGGYKVVKKILEYKIDTNL